MKQSRNRITEIKNPYMYVGLVAVSSGAVVGEMDIFNQVMSAVCKYFKVEPELLRQHGRKRKIVEPRQIAMYLLHKKGVTLSVIADYFGFDHTTVIHSRETVKDLMETDGEYYLKVQQVSVSTNLVINTPNI